MQYVFQNFPCTISWYLSTKIIHILNTLHSVHVTISITNIISYFSCSDHAAEEIKLGTIFLYINHPPMSIPITIFVEPSAPPPAKPSKLQPVKFQTSDKGMTPVPKTAKGNSLKLPSTIPADSFAQTSQHLKISANQAISNKISIAEGINSKDRIGKLRIMWHITYSTHHCEKYLLQSFSTYVSPVNSGPAWSTEHI